MNEYLASLPYVLLLNGPKGCGKTTIAKILQDMDSAIAIVDMPDPLREALYDMCYTLDQRLSTQELDWDSQDFKNAHVPGVSKQVTNRQALVALGHFVRDLFGTDFLSRRAVAAIRENRDVFNAFIIPNIRTPDELISFREAFKPERMLLVRVYREGHTWEGDLGGYISDETIPTIDIRNREGTPDLMVAELLQYVQQKESPFAEVRKEANPS
jgi:hypothetical protein